MAAEPQKTGVAVATKTRVTTRTKVIVGVAVASIALAAGFVPPLLRKAAKTSCVPDKWQCSAWSACGANGLQTRTCRPPNRSCAAGTGPATQQACTPPSVNAAPVISVVALPSTVLSSGLMTAARFSATASAAGDAELKEFSFPIAKSQELVLAGSGDSSIRRVGDATNLPGSATLVTCNNLSVQCLVQVTLAEERMIAAGTSQVFDLRLSVTSTVAGSSLTTSMDQPVAAGPWTLASDQAAPVSSAAPVVTVVALPSTVLSSGPMTAARFSATASAAGDAALKVLRFPITKSQQLVLVGSGDSSLRRVGDSANIPGVAALDACNDQSAQCSVTVTLANERVIAAGTSQVFDLRLNVTGTVAGSSLTTSMDQPVALTDSWTLVK